MESAISKGYSTLLLVSLKTKTSSEVFVFFSVFYNFFNLFRHIYQRDKFIIYTAGENMNTVYIDVLIGLNIFINYFILLAVSKITKYKPDTKRFILSSLLAGVFSLIIFIPALNLFLSFLLKFFVTSLLILTAYKISCFKDFSVLSAVYFGISFLYAGTMFFVWLCSSYDGIIINNSVVYLDISPAIFISSVVAVYAVITVIKRIFGFEIKKDRFLNLTLYYRDAKVNAKCLYDTGNFLTDIFSDFPVVVVDKTVSLALVGIELQSLKDLKNSDFGLDIRIIPCSTVSNSGILYGYKIDKASIITKEKEYTAQPVIVAVSENKLSDRYTAIIGDAFYNNCKENLKCLTQSNSK